jgi:hypothetical protein
MVTIHLRQTTTATPGQFPAGLTDFGPALATTVKAIGDHNYETTARNA